MVRHLQQVLLWPLRLMPVRAADGAHSKPWRLLREMGNASSWREVVDEYTGESERFHRMLPLPKCDYPRKPLIWFTFCGKAVWS